MFNYYVNNIPQTKGDHEVHKEECKFFPKTDSSYLGKFPSCVEAVEAAKRIHPQSNGCFYCSTPCHTS